jgi:hypothetical protein
MKKNEGKIKKRFVIGKVEVDGEFVGFASKIDENDDEVLITIKKVDTEMISHA